jgi:hypothetical protein
LRYGRWNQRKDGRYLVPALLSGSDYSGSLVQKSNHKSFSETFADGENKWWADAPGGHSTYAVVIDMQAVPEDKEEEVAEFLNALSDYPLADESLHSEMEMEAQNEAWEDWGRKDFRKAIEATYEVDLDKAEEELGEEVLNRKLSDLFYKASDKANEYWANEQGDSMWIDMERVVTKGTTDDDISSLFE